ncbi:hypothetical protein [Glycomyces sp. NPDC048151]|uniref:hypothetical protein n=1 Tax=Glycomyces sp. NPDC048151 TaxID=3364002 RepID=UPI00371F7A8D
MAIEAVKKAKLPEKVVPVCLDASAIEAYREAEQEAARAAADSLGGKITVPEELATAVEAATIRFTMRGLPRKQWTELLKSHPPRKDNLEDRKVGFNEDTLYEALVRKCIVDPVPTDEEWEQIDEALTQGEWTRLVTVAQTLNLIGSKLPF